MPTFIVMRGANTLKVVPGSILWVNDARTANTYPSKYAAKRHLKQLDNMPNDIKIVELLTLEDNLNVNS